MVHEIEDFYGVYLLYNLNPRYKGRTYIGYTVDPNRRIKQHNTGAQAGGAWRTDGKGPWEMILIIHGFPNDISALRFEWAWQHPEKSRRLRHLPKKARKETAHQFRFRIVSQMLRTGPWNRLPLTIRWLKQDYCLDFPPASAPPSHMPIVYGPVRSMKVRKAGKGKTPKESTEETCNQSEITSLNVRHRVCPVCYKRLKPDDTTVSCYHPQCQMEAHILCLAQRFLYDPGQIIPIEGFCLKCKQPLLWGDLIRHKRGCYQNLAESSTQGESQADSESDTW
ncbi:structure-specific endonuclease subunit slx1-like [Haliotis cracherodii]|uniref:structure-specific endonuclease subunit slx1-like n=1 Tax=Haliotis cracherodii TaxID=6455 RepID=UPI0039EA7EFF